jgi:hypothetical protein
MELSQKRSILSSEVGRKVVHRLFSREIMSLPDAGCLASLVAVESRSDGGSNEGQRHDGGVDAGEE